MKKVLHTRLLLDTTVKMTNTNHDNFDYAACEAVLAEVRLEIVRRLECACCGGVETTDASCGLAEQVSRQCCYRSGTCGSAFGTVRYGKLGNIDLRVAELCELLLLGCDCEATICCTAGAAAAPSDLHRIKIDDLHTRGDFLSLATLLHAMVSYADVARTLVDMDLYDVERALEELEERLLVQREQARSERRRMASEETSRNARRVHACPSLRCTLERCCDECSRVWRRREMGRRSLQRYLRDECTPFAERCARTRDYDSRNSDDEDVQYREDRRRVRTMRNVLRIAIRMREVIVHTQTALRAMLAQTLSAIENVQYEEDGACTLTPSDAATIVSESSSDTQCPNTFVTFQRELKRTLLDLRNHAQTQSTNRLGALKQYYYIDTYRTFETAAATRCSQRALFQLAHHQTVSKALDDVRNVTKCLEKTSCHSPESLRALLRRIDTARAAVQSAC